MWQSVQARLSSRWRRVAFLLWLAIVAAGLFFAAVAAFFLYEMWRLQAPFVPDCATLLEKSPFGSNGEKALAPYTFSDWSNCFNYRAYRAASLEAEMSGWEAGRLFLLAAFLGFFIFTQRWSQMLRSFWGWINLRTPPA